MTPQERIGICARVRQQTAQAMASVLRDSLSLSESGFCDGVRKRLSEDAALYDHGWYDPPPGGASALFGPGSAPERLLYDSLRKKEFWPSEGNRFEDGSVGTIYYSPVDRRSGMIGDFGMTVYRGDDEKVGAHLRRCLETVEKIADFSAIGMELGGIVDFAEKLLDERGLSNKRTLTLTGRGGTNTGHMIPWSYEDPTPEEEAIIRNADFEAVKNLISRKRINVSSGERFIVPATSAFTAELRLEDVNDPAMPNAFFHLIVTFTEGKKEVLGGFNEVFGAIGMDRYLVSRF